MGQSSEGAIRAAATRRGMSPEDYQRRLDAGEKWCVICATWHARSAFAKDKSRGDGLVASCRDSKNKAAREKYVPRERRPIGGRTKEARAGDRKQARRRVNYLVEAGIIPRPNELPCTECGASWMVGRPRHEYDHHKGYGPEHHEDVVVLCGKCHGQRGARIKHG